MVVHTVVARRMNIKPGGKQKFRDGIKSDGSKQLMHLPDGTQKELKKSLKRETYRFQD